MAEAINSSRQNAVRIRHIPIQNEGDGGLFAPLYLIVTPSIGCDQGTAPRHRGRFAGF